MPMNGLEKTRTHTSARAQIHTPQLFDVQTYVMEMVNGLYIVHCDGHCSDSTDTHSI